MDWRLFSLYLLAVTLLGISVSAAESLVGIPRVIDGDTLEIQGKPIRLLGIDAPESRQFCSKAEEPWLCGKDATAALSNRINSRSVTCETIGKPDRYGRAIAVCRLEGEDLNAWMVRQGWALAYRHYSSVYIDDETAAREAQRGIWSSNFTPPWDWRKHRRKQLSH